jgi:hypothetical protein
MFYKNKVSSTDQHIIMAVFFFFLRKFCICDILDCYKRLYVHSQGILYQDKPSDLKDFIAMDNRIRRGSIHSL